MLAALPPLVPRLPAAGQQGRARRRSSGPPTRSRSRNSPTPAPREKRLLVVVSADALAAQRLADELPWFAPGLEVALLPDWETLPYDHFSPHQDLVSQRLATLYHVSRGECDVLVVAATTALYRLAPPDYLAAFTFFLKQGTRLDVDALRAQLALAGYQHVTQVVSPGEFSVRGGLIDLFPMGSALPYRLDLFDDDIESIKTFDVDTQRTLYPVPDVRLLPAREFPLDEAGAHALSQPLSRGVRRRSVALAALQGREQRRRAGRHRVLPAALLRRDRDARRLPAARCGRRARRRRRRRRRALLAGHRIALQAAARRQGAAAAAADRRCSCRPTRSTASLKAHARIEIPAAASDRGRRRAPAATVALPSRRRSTAAPTIRSPRSSAISPPATRAC